MKCIIITAAALSLALFSCKQAGEQAGKSMTEFVSGVQGGVDEALNIKVELSEDLKKRIELGEIQLHSDTAGVDNKLSIYLILNDDIDQELRIKSYVNDKENGRTALKIKGKKGEAGYHDFVFDHRTNIDRQYTKLVIE